ncbi:MAG: TetR/AcrR family transcriptional regulator [Flavobacteriaceae bacterium]
MEKLSVQFNINPQLYSKDPESSVLGKKILEQSIILIDELGFEGFTFKKLGKKIGSNESSIYRYFRSKHTLLIYLIDWYWSWVEYKLTFATTNVENPNEKLTRSIQLLTQGIQEDDNFTHINEVLLNKIIIAESIKAYLTKDIDLENEKGYFKTYKRVVQRVSEFIMQINPNFKYPHMLVSTVIEGAHQQQFFSDHLPSITNVENGIDSIVCFYTHLVFKTIEKDE